MVRAGTAIRLTGQVCGDVVCLALGLLLGLAVRLDGESEGVSLTSFGAGRVVAGLTIAGAVLAVLEVVGLRTRGRLRYGSFEDIGRLAAVFGLTGLVVLVSGRLASQALLPASVIVAGVILGFVGSSMLRFARRLVHERRSRPSTDAEPVIVFGAGEGGEQTITAMLRDPTSPYVPVALLDDDRTKRNYSLRGVRVQGDRLDIERVARRTDAVALVIAIPTAGSDLVRELSSRATEAGLAVMVLPPVRELFGADIGVEDIRPVTEADLLGRSQVETDLPAIAGYLQGKRVLVTGAGGSIGSEICRQVWLFDPAELVMLDRDESALHRLQLDLEGRAMLDTRNLVVADIRDPERMRQVFAEHRPQVVFHAAALKHLPLLEMHPTEALKSNVFGTRNVLDAAMETDCERFVNISTDKAADPCSVLGWSKRLAEALTASAADGSGCYVSVRFGNVLGSRGSVLTSFQAQAEAGGPLTVTDPDVTRYFMTVTEAVHLVIQAAAVGRPGEVLVLDMGEPVRISDVARQIAARAPRPVQIVYTGLRPGEKLHEVLLGTGEVDDRPSHPLISHVPVPPMHEEWLHELAAASSDDVGAIAAMRKVADRLVMAVDGNGAPQGDASHRSR